MLVSLVVREDKIWNFCQHLDLNCSTSGHQIVKYGDIIYSFVDSGNKVLKMKIRKEKI